MSGGVDSSVAAGLLIEQGYEVIGCTMQVWDYTQCSVDEGMGTCCSSQDVDDARAVADELGIPFYVINCEDEFKEKVIQPFVDSYLKGETPIPCVNCNTFLKFDHLVKKMKALDCDYLATGHYAQVGVSPYGQPAVFTSVDTHKDQTYFLFTLDPELIPKLLFPVGAMEKPEVREWALKKGWSVSKKKDSTGICFVGNDSYKNFVNKHSNTSQHKPGSIKLYPENEILGAHAGIHNFTIGQRKALGVNFNEALFVKSLDPDSGDVFLCRDSDLYSRDLVLKDIHLLDDFKSGEVLSLKIRYAHEAALGAIEKSQDHKSLKVKFKDPQRAITPGQAVVIYRGKQLLGGGWIHG